MMRTVALALALTLGAFPAAATITIYKCAIERMGGPLFLTVYDDGTPARIGVASGVGNRALIFFDRLSGALVAIETNTDGIPITMTTINRDGRAVHSRQTIDPDGWSMPSQSLGACVRAEP